MKESTQKLWDAIMTSEQTVTENKLNKLLRYHRQNVFNETNGEVHHRALKRLQKTSYFIDMCERRRLAADYRRARSMERAGY